MADSKVLGVDVGGSHVKVLLSTNGAESRRFVSGPRLGAREMVDGVLDLARDWTYDKVSIGVPSPVRGGRILSEPMNLGTGWVGFDFEQAFGRPTKLVNDAAMQALGSYDGGKMLFLGLGTGLGSALICEGAVLALELAHLPYRHGKSYEDYVGAAGKERLGKQRWRKHVLDIIDKFTAAFVVDYIVLGGGNAKEMKAVPRYVRIGDNRNAFRGGFRLWEQR